MTTKPRIVEVSRSNITFNLSNPLDKFKESCSTFSQKNQATTRRKFCHMQNSQSEKDIHPIEKSNLPKVVEQIIITPPSAVPQPVQTPAAPIKEKRRRDKTNLRPRKLVYIDDELELTDTLTSVDSGFHSKHNSSLNDHNSRKGVAEYCGNVPSPKSSKSSAAAAAKRVDPGTGDAQAFRRITRNTAKLNNANKENFYGSTKKNAFRNETQKSKKKDKANDLNDAKKTAGKHKGFNPNCTVLSQCSEELDWQSTLRWLQPRRDVGLWIQCCRLTCQKWRYVEEYHDPVDVPEQWFCEMNSDKSIASCDIPEVPKSAQLEEDLIENKYNAGSIVWVHIKGFPWWPAMVDDAPETMSYYKLSQWSISPTKYHVIFFSEKVESAWVSPKNIKPFNQYKKEELVKKTIYRKVEYKDQIEEACKLAKTALKLSILERLQKFGILARCTNEATGSSVDKSHDCDMNNNVPNTCSNNDSMISDLLSSQTSNDDDEDYVQTSQPTIQTSISVSGSYRLKSSLFKRSATDFDKNDASHSEHNRSLKKKVSWNIQRSQDAPLCGSMKDNISNVNDMHSASSSSFDYHSTNTISLIHDTDSYKNNLSPSQSNISSKVSKFWEKADHIQKNKPELCEQNVSPKIPHKQMKIDYNEATCPHSAVINDTIDVHMPKDIPSASSKSFSTMEQIRQWQKSLKNYTEAYRKTFPF